MMQLLCKWQAQDEEPEWTVLDLYENADLQFTHDNPLFAFDKLSCERTTNFKLPATPTNDHVFSAAKIPNYYGEGMRRKFDAQLQAGLVVKNGYLYVNNFDGKDYNAVFVTGEFIGLQAIKNLGKIKDIIHYNDTEVLGGTPVSPGAAASTMWANVNYKHQTGLIVHPSMLLERLYSDIASQYNLNVQAIPSAAQGIRIIPTKVNGCDEYMRFKCGNLDYYQPASPAPEDPFNELTYDHSLFEEEATDYRVNIMSHSQYFHVIQFKAKTRLTLTFPENFPDTMYVYDLSEEHDDPTSGHFYGDRYFTSDSSQQTETHITRYGQPLAGRSVEIEMGGTFMFVDERYYANFRVRVDSSWQYVSGFMLTDEPMMVFDLRLRVTTNPEPGEIIRLQDNLPDVNFVELLKTIAALSGRVLNYSDKDGVTFDELILPAFNQIELDTITKKSDVDRKFADYTKNNYVQFNDPNATKILIDYTIDNDNLADEKNLQVIPFSEGGQDGALLYINNKIDKHTLGASLGGSFLSRVSLIKNEGLQALCDASTQFKIEVRQTALEYQRINAKTKLLVEGAQYVWTARQWQKDMSKFTLAKIGDMYSPYSIAATAALRSTFNAATWDVIRLYGFAHPSIITYMNAYAPIDPLIAYSLVPTIGVRFIHGGYTNQVSTGIVPTTTMTIHAKFRMNSVTAYHATFQQGYVSEEAMTTRCISANGAARRLTFTHCGRTGGSGYAYTPTFDFDVQGTWIDMQMDDAKVIVNGTTYNLTGTNRGTTNTNPIWLLGRGNNYGSTDVDFAIFETIDGKDKHAFVPFKIGDICYILDLETGNKIQGTFTIVEESI